MDKFEHLRARFCAELARRQLYYALALFGECRLSSEEGPAPAWISLRPHLQINLHPKVVNHVVDNKDYLPMGYLLFLHEVRHILQAEALADAEALLDLRPLVKRLRQTGHDSDADAVEAGKLPEHLKKWVHGIMNVAADAALHVDLAKLFGEELFTQMDDYLRDEYEDCRKLFDEARQDPKLPDRLARLGLLKPRVSAATPKVPAAVNAPPLRGGPSSRVDAIVATCPLRGQDTPEQPTAYVEEELFQAFRESIGAQRVEKLQRRVGFPELRPDAELLEIANALLAWESVDLDVKDGGGGGGEGNGTLDEHNLGEGERQAAAEALKQTLERAKADGKRLAHEAGTGAADEEMSVGRASIAKKVKQVLDALRLKFIHLGKDKRDSRYSYTQINRSLPELDYLPGRLFLPKPERQAVIIIDVSGSMFAEALATKMVAMARHMQRQGKLLALFAGDTVFHKVDLTEGTIKLRGGGGTSLYPKDLLEMAKEAGATKPVDFVYLTDECCTGLDESKRPNKAYQLHVINVVND